MSRRRRRRRDLRALRRLKPFLRRYTLRIVGLLAVTLVLAGADVARVELIKPLFEGVFDLGVDVKALVAERLRAPDLGPAEQAEVARTVAGAEVVRSRGDLRALQDDLTLGGAIDPAVSAPATAEDETAAALARTNRILAETADRVPRADLAAWAHLGRAAALQRDAVAAWRAGQVGVATALTDAARGASFDATFALARGTLSWVVAAAIGLGFVLALLSFVTVAVARTLTARVHMDLQDAAAAHLLTLSVGYFEGAQRGDLLSRLTADLQATARLTSTLTDLIVRGTQVVVLVSWAVWTAPLLSVGLVGVGGTLMTTIRWFGKRIHRSARRRFSMGGAAFQSLQQMLEGIREVKAFQRERFEVDRFQAAARQAFEAQVRAIYARVGSRTLIHLSNDLALPLLFLVGGGLVAWGAMDVGSLGVFLGVVLLMYQPAKIVGESYNALMDTLPALDRLGQVLDQQPEVTDRSGATPHQPLREGIACEGVSFAYGDGESVLRDVSFTAPVGTLTALVGPTGSGKSTLVDLIARYRDPTAGRIAVDGRDLRDVELASYLRRVAVVPQEGFLFNATIRDNIRYGRLDASDAEVEAAARRARIHDEIVAFPAGYETVVGERGGRLSGGQVQRVAIARAMLREAEVVILDEATSALDTKTERQVQAELDKLAEGATAFVVAHRLSTVQRADQILVFDRGRLVEQGSHDELLAKGELYAALVARQLEGDPSCEAPALSEAPGPEPEAE